MLRTGGSKAIPEDAVEGWAGGPMEEHIGQLDGREAEIDIDRMTLSGSDASSVRRNREALPVVSLDDLVKLGAR